MKRVLPPLALNAWLRYDAIQRAVSVVPPGSTLLEIGAGQGGIGARLALTYQYTGCEPDPRSAALARLRIQASGGRFVHGPETDLAAQERFAAVGAFEVLEHIEDDLEALHRWVGRLVPGGWLILSVPAFQRRFAAADRLVGHYRRYDPEDLRGRLTQLALRDIQMWITGFPLGVLLEWGRNLVAGVSVKRMTMQERSLASGRWLQPPERAGLLTESITLPFRYMQRPFETTRLGTGLVARARLPRR